MKMEQPEVVGSPAGAAGPARRRVITSVVLGVLVLGALLALGAWPRMARARQLAAAARARGQGVPSVAVAEVARAPAETELALPGNVQALTEASVFARADGYITRRLADIGDRVERGQLLAEIDSPELDQQIREAEATVQRAGAALRQAEAASQQVQANLRLAEITARRWLALADKGVLSRQDGAAARGGHAPRGARHCRGRNRRSTPIGRRDMTDASKTPMERLAAVSPAGARIYMEHRAAVMEGPELQALTPKVKLLVGIGVAAALQSSTCTLMWGKLARKAGATDAEIVEAILVSRLMKMATVNDTAAEALAWLDAERA